MDESPLQSLYHLLHTIICFSDNGEIPAMLTGISALRLGSDVQSSLTHNRFSLSLSHWNFHEMPTVSV